jgi:hypothetical protein
MFPLRFCLPPSIKKTGDEDMDYVATMSAEMIGSIPPARRTPPEAVVYLRRAHGIRTTVGTLARYRCVGIGPRFRKAGPKAVLYDDEDLDAWAIEKVGSLRNSTRC